MKLVKQLGLLLWKNYLNQKRQVVWTILELVIPLTFTTIFVGMRQTVDSKMMNVTLYSPFYVTGTWLDFWQKIDGASIINPNLTIASMKSANVCVPFNPKLIYYAPSTRLTDAVMAIVSARTELNIQGYPNEDAMVNDITTIFNTVQSCNISLLGGIYFDPHSFGNNSFVNNSLVYSIRLSNTMRNQNHNKTQQTKMVNVNKGWNTNLDYPEIPMLGPREPNSTDGGKPGYWRETFLTLQKAVDAAVTTVAQYGINPDNWPKAVSQCNMTQKEMDMILLYVYCTRHPNATLPQHQKIHICEKVIHSLDQWFSRNFSNECLNALAEDPGLASVMLQRFPYPTYLNNPYIAVIQQNLPILIMLSYVISALYIIRYVTIEKEKRLKEYMRVMGLSNLVQWTAYFIINMLKLLVSVVYMSIMLTVPINHKSVMDKSDPTVIFVFLFVYSICTVCYCFTISVFFKRGNTAAAFGGIIWFIGYVPYFFLQPRYASLSRSTKFASSLLFSTAMSYGAQIIGAFEGQDTGITWSNINQPATMNDNFTMVDVIIMMLIDAGLCLFVTWYVEAVHPGDEGVPQPFYFPFMISYWCPQRNHAPSTQPIDLSTVEESESDKIEPYPEGHLPQVVVKKLTKVFGRKMKRKIAVNELCLRMYPGQTTVLLGHNGAGKSTTMAMLTGMMAPTSGTATLNGFDIRNGLDAARKYIGLCPQYNPLFDNMTVMEHVKFFCKLKGRPLNMEEVQRFFHSLGLDPKVNCLAKALSGGMKRKLCLAIALVGGSEIVMLDEPTSGMDPSARHEAWHLLQMEKRNRTILLTTHYMEEADLLGDRIAILSHGKLQCFGSSLFLKHIYGAGYHLTVIFDKVEDESQDIKERAEIVVDMIREQVPDAQVESAVGAEASFLLPTDHRDKYIIANCSGVIAEGPPIYQMLFHHLEASQQNLAVLSFGVSVTTMEEVFLRVGKEADDRHYHRVDSNQPTVSIKDLAFGTNTRVIGFMLMLQQFKALIIKRALHSLRNWLVLIAQLVIPVALLVVSILVNMMLPGPGLEPPLALNLNHFGNTTIGLAQNNINAFTSTITDHYISSLASQNQKFENISGDQLDDYPHDDNNHIIAAIFDTLSIPLLGLTIPHLTAGFNNEPYHGPGITLNAIDNAILSAASNGTYQVTTINHPLPPTNLDKINDWISSGVIEFNIALFLMFGMSFLASSFVVLLIRERVTKAKHLQLLGGLPSSIFWLTSFVWDYLNYLMTVGFLLIVLKAFSWSDAGGTSVLVDDGRWLHTLLILMLYGWATLPMMYCFSFAFSSPASGFVMMTIFNILSGMALFAITSVFLLLGMYHLYKIIHFVFMVFFPTFCLGETIDLYYMNYFVKVSCEPYLKYCNIYKESSNNTCCKPGIFTNNFLQWHAPGIGCWLFFMFLQGFCSFLLLTVIETGRMRSLVYGLKKSFANRKPLTTAGSTRFYADMDTDVVDESETAKRVSCAEVPVVARDLTKYYGSFVAVNKVNFVVQNGECFGLLGVNGAGKTTTFQMLTGENSLTDGDAFIVGTSIRRHWREAGKMVGYCPQFDALIDQMTGREHLYMFARLKGMPAREIKTIAANVIYAVGITEYADKQVKTYSGGNKRKLSLGIGLVGAPKVLLLDEPTSGVDPASRRLIWNVLAQVRGRGVAVVLTSHSMEECEALCTRLAIMVDGKFKCLGSSQHLKTKRGKGYTLLVKLADISDIERALKVMDTNFPGCILKEMHHCQLHYEIPVSETRTWSSLFGTLEKLVEPLHIVDYSLSQITLEQIFLSLLQEKNRNVISNLSVISHYDNVEEIV